TSKTPTGPQPFPGSRVKKTIGASPKIDEDLARRRAGSAHLARDLPAPSPFRRRPPKSETLALATGWRSGERLRWSVRNRGMPLACLLLADWSRGEAGGDTRDVGGFAVEGAGSRLSPQSSARAPGAQADDPGRAGEQGPGRAAHASQRREGHELPARDEAEDPDGARDGVRGPRSGLPARRAGDGPPRARRLIARGSRAPRRRRRAPRATPRDRSLALHDDRGAVAEEALVR